MDLPCSYRVQHLALAAAQPRSSDAHRGLGWAAARLRLGDAHHLAHAHQHVRYTLVGRAVGAPRWPPGCQPHTSLIVRITMLRSKNQLRLEHAYELGLPTHTFHAETHGSGWLCVCCLTCMTNCNQPTSETKCCSDGVYRCKGGCQHLATLCRPPARQRSPRPSSAPLGRPSPCHMHATCSRQYIEDRACLGSSVPMLLTRSAKLHRQ